MNEATSPNQPASGSEPVPVITNKWQTWWNRSLKSQLIAMIALTGLAVLYFSMLPTVSNFEDNVFPTRSAFTQAGVDVEIDWISDTADAWVSGSCGTDVRLSFQAEHGDLRVTGVDLQWSWLFVDDGVPVPAAVQAVDAWICGPADRVPGT